MKHYCWYSLWWFWWQFLSILVSLIILLCIHSKWVFRKTILVYGKVIRFFFLPSAQPWPHLAFDRYSLYHQCKHFCIFGQRNNDSIDDTSNYKIIRKSWLESSTGTTVHYTECQQCRSFFANWFPSESSNHRRPLHCTEKYYIFNIQHASMHRRPFGYHSNKFSSSNSA